MSRRSTLALLALLLAAACGPAGGGGGGGGGGDDCPNDLEVTFPDGSSTTIPGCGELELTAGFEFDPDDPAELRTYSLRFDGAPDDEGFDCEVTLVQVGVCGPGWYDVGESAGLSVTTLDCEGTADAFEGVYAATSGQVQLTEASTEAGAGDLTGEPVALTLAGAVEAELAGGLSFSGSFRVETTVVASDAEEQACLPGDGPGDDDDAADDDDAPDDDDAVDDDDAGSSPWQGEHEGEVTMTGEGWDQEIELCDGPVELDVDGEGQLSGDGECQGSWSFLFALEFTGQVEETGLAAGEVTQALAEDEIVVPFSGQWTQDGWHLDWSGEIEASWGKPQPFEASAEGSVGR